MRLWGTGVLVLAMVAAFLAATGTDGVMFLLSVVCVGAVVGIVGGGMLIMGGDWRMDPAGPALQGAPAVTPETTPEAV